MRCRSWLPLLVVVSAYLMADRPAQAGVGIGGGIIPRREYHRETGDFRLAGEAFAPGYKTPYWGWLGVTNELLKLPNVGSATFSFILVTEDGKPVRHAKWTDDQRKPMEFWCDLQYGQNGFELPYHLDGVRPGNKTMFFAGSIKGGQRNYTKVWLLVDITIGGRRKDRRQVEALQFMVYDLRVGRGPVDPVLLVNAQEQMGAGGSSLIGPDIEETLGNGGSNGGGETSGNAGGAIPMVFQGFSSWVRVEWDGGEVDYLFVDGTASLPIRGKSFDLYIVSANGQRQGGQRIKHNGQLTSFSASVGGVTVTRTAR